MEWTDPPASAVHPVCWRLQLSCEPNSPLESAKDTYSVLGLVVLLVSCGRRRSFAVVLSEKLLRYHHCRYSSSAADIPSVFAARTCKSGFMALCTAMHNPQRRALVSRFDYSGGCAVCARFLFDIVGPQDSSPGPAPTLVAVSLGYARALDIQKTYTSAGSHSRPPYVVLPARSNACNVRRDSHPSTHADRHCHAEHCVCVALRLHLTFGHGGCPQDGRRVHRQRGTRSPSSARSIVGPWRQPTQLCAPDFASPTRPRYRARIVARRRRSRLSSAAARAAIQPLSRT